MRLFSCAQELTVCCIERDMNYHATVFGRHVHEE